MDGSFQIPKEKLIQLIDAVRYGRDIASLKEYVSSVNLDSLNIFCIFRFSNSTSMKKNISEESKALIEARKGLKMSKDIL